MFKNRVLSSLTVGEVVYKAWFILVGLEESEDSKVIEQMLRQMHALTEEFYSPDFHKSIEPRQKLVEETGLSSKLIGLAVGRFRYAEREGITQIFKIEYKIELEM